MLSGSTILRAAGLIVVAACLATLVQRFWPQAGGGGPQVATAPAPAPVPAPAPRVIRPVDPVPPTSVAGTQPPPTPVPVPAAPSARPLPAPGGLADPAPAMPRPQPAPPATLSAVPPVTPEQAGQDAVAEAVESAGPRALGSVDLNTASVADLNTLRGGGMIGRAIVQKRPYASVGELLSKRVLSRATFERIKDQVTVR